MINITNKLKQKLTSAKSKYKFLIKDWTSLTDLHACQKVLETKRFSRKLRPVQLEAPDAKKIVVIAPHQDDDIYGAGGTILKAIDSGAKVHVVYLTQPNNEQQARLVYKETEEVCSKSETIPHFLKQKTGQIPLNDFKLNANLLRIIQDVQPGIVFIPFLMDDHDDHRRVNELLYSILKNERTINFEIWAYQIYSSIIPNVVVDITEHSQRKKEIIKIWKSVSGQRDWAHYILGMNAANSRWISSKTPIYVEAFFVVPVKEYLELCGLYFQFPSKCYYGKYYIGSSQRKDLQNKTRGHKKIFSDTPPEDIYPLF